MNLPRFALTHRSIVIAFLAVILGVGIFNLTTMPRREDPEITMRDALVVTPWPGASSPRVEELVTDLLEGAIATISEVETVTSKSLNSAKLLERENIRAAASWSQCPFGCAPQRRRQAHPGQDSRYIG